MAENLSFLVLERSDNTEPPSSRHPGRPVALSLSDLIRFRETLKTPGLEISELTFILFDDLSVTLHTELLEPLGDDGFMWRGRLQGVQDVRGYLAVSGLSKRRTTVASGSILFGTQSYLISPLGDGIVWVAEEICGQATCAGALQPQSDLGGGAAAGASVSTPPSAVAPPDELALIRVLALFSSETARAMPGGAPAILAMMGKAQVWTNDAFQISNINARVEITAQESVAIRRSNVETLLQSVVGNRDSDTWAAVTRLRDAANASVVALLTDILHHDSSGGYVAGISSDIPEPPHSDQSDLSHATLAMSLSNEYSTGPLFAHELGHLLGGKHDRLTQPTRAGLDPSLDYVRGYIPEDLSFVTIMGYPRDNIHYVPAYSAADRKWKDTPLGIPMGQPNAADAAHFFRVSTKAVASYRGANTPKADWVLLHLDSTPDFGGTVSPSSLGPFPLETVVKVMAIPRAGYKFSHWNMDGQPNVSSNPQLDIKMDKRHSLLANFVSNDTFCTLSITQPPDDSHLTIGYTHDLDEFEGDTFIPGELVHLLLDGPSAGYKLKYWLVNGHPAGDDPRLKLRMERDMHVEVVLRTTKKFIDDRMSRDTSTISSKSEFRAEVWVIDEYEKRLPNEWIVFSLRNPPDGVFIAGEARVKTDHLGAALVRVHTGTLKGSVLVEASLEGSDAGRVIRYVALNGFALVPISPESLHLYDGENSTQVDVQVTEAGHPVSAGISVSFALSQDAEGFSLSPQNAVTNEQGVASAVLRYTAKMASVLYVFVSKDDDSLPVDPLQFTLSVFSARTLRALAPVVRHTKIGAALSPLVVQVTDTLSASAGGGEFGPVGVSMHFALTDGGTGIALLSNTSDVNGNWEASVGLAPAKALGTATIVARCAHQTSASALSTFTIHVLADEGMLKPVGGDSQKLHINDVPSNVTVEITYQGKPLEGVRVHPRIDKSVEGLELLRDPTVFTDAQGRATIVVLGQASKTGRMEISIQTDLTPSLIASIDVD